ncbi:MAG TPA: cation diffusion facilitator family transporter [Pseudogracilibacillus sp.]|nr:cation diffusion facilitator family transporter [Pseudogracilibacillus sp.]
MRLLTLAKKGNVASLLAALGNLAISIVKFIVAFISGNGTMFATAMHSMADTVNQTFVYIGSILSEMKPTKRFPTGFGRIINIVCMVAVVVVTVMAYETIKSGWNLFITPQASSDFILNIAVLLFSFTVDGYILFKTMHEIVHETKKESRGNLMVSAFKNARKAAPATKLVFYEDIVAVLGAVLAMTGIILAQFFEVLRADGIVAMLIGVLMFIVAFRVGYDNMLGLIGVAAPSEVEQKVADKILADSCVVDIYEMRIVQEGRAYHIDVTVELKKGLTLNEADDLKFRLTDQLLLDPDITDVVLGIIEDNDETTWTKVKGRL